jgi:Putative Zn-dependent protease, contains TPR repeats
MLETLRQLWHKLQNKYQVASFCLLVLLACLVSVNLPFAAKALDLRDLLRIIPSAVQIIQLSNLSDQDEVALGQSIDQQIRTQVRISRNPRANQLVKDLGQLLVRSSDRPDIPYTFQVVEDRNLNAFATMGGFVYINTGTIASADNIAQLASVIAHEIGHIAGKHALEQMRQMAIARGIATVAGVQDDRLVNIGVQLALRLPRSREAEFDADRRGVFNLARAGMAPQAMPAFMQKLERGDGGAPDFLRTHPATSDRIAALNEIIRQNNLTGTVGLNDREYQQEWRRL